MSNITSDNKSLPELSHSGIVCHDPCELHTTSGTAIECVLHGCVAEAKAVKGVGGVITRDRNGQNAPQPAEEF